MVRASVGSVRRAVAEHVGSKVKVRVIWEDTNMM